MLIIFSLWLGVAVLQISARHGLHERRTHLDESWVKRERIHPETLVPVRISLAQQNLDIGQDFIKQL